MATHKKYPTLGRGLDALISSEDVHTDGGSSIGEVDVRSIEPNPGQPRRAFDEAALEELAESIRQVGVVQPVSLRDMGGGRYQIIAGERRWRAAQKAGLRTLPAYIRTADDEKMMQMALIENIQREDLNAIEIALAYQNLMDSCGLKQEELAGRVGKNRATVTNYLRLLRLPAQVQMAVKEGTLDQGHARALLGVESPTAQMRLFNEIKEKGCSVREVEQMVRALQEGGTLKSGRRRITDRSANTLPEEYAGRRDRIAALFGAKVSMRRDVKGKGSISIAFKNDKELERILLLLDKAGK